METQAQSGEESNRCSQRAGSEGKKKYHFYFGKMGPISAGRRQECTVEASICQMITEQLVAFDRHLGISVVVPLGKGGANCTFFVSESLGTIERRIWYLFCRQGFGTFEVQRAKRIECIDTRAGLLRKD